MESFEVSCVTSPHSDSCVGSAQSRKALRSTKRMRSLTRSSESHRSARRSGGSSSSSAQNDHMLCSRLDYTSAARSFSGRALLLPTRIYLQLTPHQSAVWACGRHFLSYAEDS